LAVCPDRIRELVTFRAQKTDEELMLACQKGDSKALDKLYKRYYQRIYSFIRRYVNDNDKAQDILQETFLRVFNWREKYAPTAKFASWLYRIARNLCIDEKRRYWNRMVELDSQAGLDENSQGPIEVEPEKGFNPREALDDSDRMETIRSAIESLSEEQRDVIVLNKYQGLSYQEIGEVLGISTESVKQRAYRAHLKLREMLEPLLVEPE